MKISNIAFCIVLAISSCHSKSSREEVKLEQYKVEGHRLYAQHCSNCHQENGKGVGRLFPPLNQSDYMDTKLNAILCLIRNGVNGELEVNGVIYNQPMPGVPELTDLEVAEIATYIYNSWGHNKGIIDVKVVHKLSQKCDK